MAQSAGRIMRRIGKRAAERWKMWTHWFLRKYCTMKWSEGNVWGDGVRRIKAREREREKKIGCSEMTLTKVRNQSGTTEGTKQTGIKSFPFCTWKQMSSVIVVHLHLFVPSERSRCVYWRSIGSGAVAFIELNCFFPVVSGGEGDRCTCRLNVWC